jgi:chromate transporter
MDDHAAPLDNFPAPQALPLPRLFARFLRFGCLAFGGPVAQIAMLRQALVEEERWVAPERFNRLLAVMQALPGPEAHELCVHLGIVARGRIGGLLAGLGFLLPGFVLMMALAWAYTAFIAGRTELAAPLLGIQIAVLAVIARAIPKIGKHILTSRATWGFAALALAATLAGVPFWVPLIAAGLAYAAIRTDFWAVVAVAAAVIAAVLVMPPGSAPAALPSPPGGATLAALFIAGLKGGLLTFGGAYTAIPYVRADTVGRGWLSDGQFLDGVAFANVIPAPLVIFATFAGYVAGGPGGAAAITAGMFLPAFAFSMIFYERLEALVDEPRLHRLLDGVAAAAMGIIAATLVQLALATWPRIDSPLPALAIFAAALALAFWLKRAWAAPAIIAAAGVAGWALL